MSAHPDLLMFAAAVLLLLRGYPVAFTLAGTGFVFAILGAIFDVGYFEGGDLSFIRPYYNRVFGLMDEVNEVLVAVPLFIFMGVMLERSKVASELLDTMGKYVLKTTVMLFALLPGLQGVSNALKAALRLAGHTIDNPGRSEGRPV